MVLTLVVLVGMWALWFYWFNDVMGGGGRRSKLPVVGLDVEYGVVASSDVDVVPLAVLLRVGEDVSGRLGAAWRLMVVEAAQFARARRAVVDVGEAEAGGVPLSGGGAPALAGGYRPQGGGAVVTAASEYVGAVRGYNPDAGPAWCDVYHAVGRQCVSGVTSDRARPWFVWRGRGAACDVAWLGREVEVDGLGRYVCVDTGVSFCLDGCPWLVGLLTDYTEGVHRVRLY